MAGGRVQPADTWRLFPSGDSCLIAECDALPGPDTSLRIAAAAVRLRAAMLPGVHDVVPALTTIGLHYRPGAIAGRAASAGFPYEELARRVQAVLATGIDADAAQRELIEVPVCYGGAHGPDLEEAAVQCGMPAAQLVALHGAEPVTVLTLGFAPGMPYLGRFDERLALPRRASPRTAVPPGAIGLANRQSVIYTLALPGGWSLIGRTPLALFDPMREEPALLQAGDRVRFRAIQADEFDSLAAAAQRRT